MKSNKFISLLIVITLQCLSIFGQDTEPEFEKLNQNLHAQYADKFGFSVIIADEKKVLFNNNYGFADSLKVKKTGNSTLFQIASVNKSFTAIGIFKLIEEKKIYLSDSIERFFSNVPKDKQSITIAQLLSHKSGFQQNYVCFGIKKSNEALKALFKDTLGSVPGKNFDYSNQNYELLALIIEKVTGLSYEEYIRNNILKPLKLKNTFFWDEVKDMKNIAHIKQVIPDSLKGKNWDYTGSAGIYSTSYDLYKFINAVISNRILDSATLSLMLSEQYRTTSGLSICYGWFKNDSTDWNTTEIWTRGNEDWGHNAVIRWFPEKNRIIIVCTNSGELGDKQITGNRIISNYIADFLWK